LTEPKTPITNRKTGSATSTGGYANTGVHVGDVNVNTGTPVRTSYLAQVRRIAPSDLLDRDVELFELGAFCTDPATRGCYAWWRAEAWAGKSALMSWFLLNPPPNVRLVSFFITARLASQNDRIAFCDNVIGQLAVILGEPVPQITDATRDPSLLGMLEAVADQCRERGEEFVLIVDGLDEDRGVTTGCDAYSVAALLPVELPAGMRIILTGRPHPPVPDDVPDHHPIRDPRVVRSLSTAPEAKVVRADMMRELKGLLEGGEGERALLGFLTVAGGGLTALDLAELTGKPSWRVEEHLGTVAGRSFTRRGGYWQPELSPEAYLLGHEELQSAAEDLLGDDQLKLYREQLHGWADGYRDRCWPPGTPEYLLRGYFQMLASQGDTERMIRFATDHLRHGRMLDASGGDAAALAEIASTQDAILAAADVDLKAMICLAMHRDYLTDRNVDIPVGLPAVWAILGQPSRAEALTKSISDPSLRCAAYFRVAHAMAEADNMAVVEDCVNQALAIIRTTAEDEQRGELTKSAVDTMVAIGKPDWAKHFVESLGELGAQAALEASLAAHGDTATLSVYLESIVPIDVRATELSQMVGMVLGRAAPGARAPSIPPTIITEWITEARFPASAKIYLAVAAKRMIQDRRPTDALVAADADEAVLAAVALAACTAGYIDAGALLVRVIENPARRVDAVTALAAACVASGDLDGAESLLSVCGGSEYRAEATMSLAAEFAAIGSRDRALALIMQRELLIKELMEEDGHTELKARAAQALAAVEDFGEAERVARSITGANDLARVFTDLAAAVIAKGDYDAARAFATEAETFARMSVTTTTKVRGFTALAQAFATAGDFERAEQIAHTAVAPDGEPSALEHLARYMVIAGHRDRATRIANAFLPLVRDRVLVDLVLAVGGLEDLTWAEHTANSVSSGPARIRALASCARLAGQCGALARAIRIMLTIPDVAVRTEVAVSLLRHAADTGDRETSQRVVDWAKSQATNDSRPTERHHAQLVLAAALAAGGDFAAAEHIANAMPEPDERDRLIVSIIAMAAWRGDREQADRMLRLLTTSAAPEWALEEMITAAIAADDLMRAVKLANTLTDQGLRDHMRVEIAAAGGGELVAEIVAGIHDVEQRGWALAAAADNGVVLPALDQVDVLVREIPDGEARLELLLALVEVMPAAGHVALARHLIRSTPEPEFRGQAWAVLAEYLNSEEATNAVALAARWGRWSDALGTFARLRPSALSDVQAEFFVLNPDNAIGQGLTG
jgi:hypothetical protein